MPPYMLLITILVAAIPASVEAATVVRGLSNEEAKAYNLQLNENVPIQISPTLRYNGGLATGYRIQQNYTILGVYTWNLDRESAARARFDGETEICRDELLYSLAQERRMTIARFYRDQEGGLLYSAEVPSGACPLLLRRPALAPPAPRQLTPYEARERLRREGEERAIREGRAPPK